MLSRTSTTAVSIVNKLGSFTDVVKQVTMFESPADNPEEAGGTLTRICTGTNCSLLSGPIVISDVWLLPTWMIQRSDVSQEILYSVGPFPTFFIDRVNRAKVFGLEPRPSVPAGTVTNPSTLSISTERRMEWKVVGAILSLRVMSLTKSPGRAKRLSKSASSSVRFNEITTLSPSSPNGDRTHGPASLRVRDHSSNGAFIIPESSIICTADAVSSTVISEVPSFKSSSWYSAQLTWLGSIF